MHFEVEHVFDAPIEIVEAAMFHPDYATFLVEQSDLINHADLKSLEDDGLHIRRRVQVAPVPSFDRIGTRKVPPEWFEFVEESVWDRKGRKLQFQNIPVFEEIARRLTNRGEVSLEVASAGKTRRRTQGEVRIQNLPLIVKPLTGLVESMLAREAKRMLDAEANILRTFLADRKNTLEPVVQA
jgi:hypothetical protein